MVFAEARPDPNEPKVVVEFTTLEDIDKRLRDVRPWWDATYYLTREANTIYVNRKGFDNSRVRVGDLR